MAAPHKACVAPGTEVASFDGAREVYRLGAAHAERAPSAPHAAAAHAGDGAATATTSDASSTSSDLDAMSASTDGPGGSCASTPSRSRIR